MADFDSRWDHSHMVAYAPRTPLPQPRESAHGRGLHRIRRFIPCRETTDGGRGVTSDRRQDNARSTCTLTASASPSPPTSARSTGHRIGSSSFSTSSTSCVGWRQRRSDETRNPRPDLGYRPAPQSSSARSTSRPTTDTRRNYARSSHSLGSTGVDLLRTFARAVSMRHRIHDDVDPNRVSVG
jgi:hypothetical protein